MTSDALSSLPTSEKAALPKLIKAAMLMDALYYKQRWSGTKAFLDALPKGSSPTANYAHINKGPWCELDRDNFVPAGMVPFDIPEKPPPGGTLYPDDMEPAEFEEWLKGLPEAEAKDATGFFHVIRRAPGGVKGDGKLLAVPYSVEYADELSECASLLDEAAALTASTSLKTFLTARAAAFRSNEYADSDALWLQLDSPIHVTIGPYETYMDEHFGYKATFESYLSLRDGPATDKLALFQGMLRELEQQLPCDDKFKYPDSIKPTHIKVVEVLFSAGDTAGPMTLAFCLPNDETVTAKHGTALILQRNVSGAKFSAIVGPIAKVMLPERLQQYVTFDAFYTHTLCHECCHAIGPHDIPDGQGGWTTVRARLTSLHSALEEAKADAVGLWATHYMLDKGLITGLRPEDMYVSYLVCAMRSMRFGVAEAHGKGYAIQLGLLVQSGSVKWDGALLDVDLSTIRASVAQMAKTILEAQGSGDRAAAEAMCDTAIAAVPASLLEALRTLRSVPVDVVPSWPVLAEYGFGKELEVN